LGPESNYAVKRIMHLSDMQLSGVHCTIWKYSYTRLFRKNKHSVNRSRTWPVCLQHDGREVARQQSHYLAHQRPA